MENALKCPFCETQLEQMHDKKMFGCSKCLHIADGAFWAKVIQVKQDLNILKDALKRISSIRENTEDYYGGVSINYKQMVSHIDEIATKAIEQTTHDGKDK